MKTGALWVMVLVLAVVIVILAYVLFITPAQAPTIETPATSTPTSALPEPSSTSTAPSPLHERVSVGEPASGAQVGKSFDVKGEAPGPWYFEATFPIQVRDKDNNVIGRAHANAQGEWMTEGQVPFVATVSIDTNYTGAATLILMRDNPSGLPENDDSLEIPITIK